MSPSKQYITDPYPNGGRVYLELVVAKDTDGERLFDYWIMNCTAHTNDGWCDCLALAVSERKGTDIMHKSATLAPVKVSVPLFPKSRLFSLCEVSCNGRFTEMLFTTKNELTELGILSMDEGLRDMRNMILPYYEDMLSVSEPEWKCGSSIHALAAQTKLMAHVESNFPGGAGARHTRLAEFICLHEVNMCITCWTRNRTNVEADFGDLVPDV